MKRLTVSLVVVLVVSSSGYSNGAAPALDPFFRNVTISPPSTQMGQGGSFQTPSPAAPSYATPAVVAAPVHPNNRASNNPWASPVPPNVRPESTAASSSNAFASQPSQPIYLSQPAIEDSLRPQNYNSMPSNTRSNAGSTNTAAGSGRANPSSLQIYPAPNLQAVNGKPVREQSNISYHSADGSTPEYGDPRSSFGLSPRSRFQRTSQSTEAPAWAPGQASTNSNPERIGTPRLGSTQSRTAPSNLAQLRVTPGTPTSSSDIEKLLPPIRGYATSNQTARAQSTQRRFARASTARRSYSRPTSTRTAPPQGFPTPTEVVNIADLPPASRIATRPSRSRSSGRIRRLNYETPANGDSQGVSPSARDTEAQPVAFTSPVLYDHEEDYSQLRGKLELSDIDQRWKLRYISVGSEKSDDYGGSVILNDATKLSGFKRGDFIEVQGRILSGPQSDWGYARCYDISKIRRIR